MKEIVSGVFQTVEEANDVIDELLESGFRSEDISVMMNHRVETRSAHAAPESDRGSYVLNDVAGGGIIGGAIGAVIAAGLAATGAIGAAVVTGGVAAPLVAGPLAAALAGGGAGAAAGGILGALTGLGISQERSQQLLTEVEQGSIVVAVRTESQDAEMARSILREQHVLGAHF